MMSSRPQNPFVGAAFQSSLKPRNVNYLGYLGNKFPRKPQYDIIPRAKKNDLISHGIRFSQSFGENVEILWKNIELRSGFVVKSVKEPFTRSKAIVRSLSTVWEEGLLLFHCSVFYAVISGVCLSLWYSQLKAKTLIESKLFPSVCTTLSDYIQCDLHFCKARSVSPLSITLESCWIGPHKEEFSCDGVLQKHLSLSVLGTKRVSLIGLGNAPISSSSSISAYRSLGESVASSAKASQANNVVVALASSQDLTPELKLTTASAIATELEEFRKKKVAAKKVASSNSVNGDLHEVKPSVDDAINNFNKPSTNNNPEEDNNHSNLNHYSNIRLEDALRNSKDSHLKDFTSTNPYTTVQASVNKSSPKIPSSSNN
ncbi:hypothetical protein Lser_V15G18393 [Lactuca serriola]